jgi:hypothetical protein
MTGILSYSKPDLEALIAHVGHHVELVGCGIKGEPPWTDVQLECHDCSCAIFAWELSIYGTTKPKKKRKK